MTREQLAQILGFTPSDEQWAAISAPLHGPLLVLAGAGSGKTAVMSARVVWLVATGEVRRDQVLGLTFTNKAAGELATRIRQLLSRLPEEALADTGEPVIRTYHAFAMDLLAEWGLLVGAEPSSALLAPTDLAVRTYRAVARSRTACEELGTSVIRTVSDRVATLDDELSEHLVTPEQLRDHDERLLLALEPESGADARTVREVVRRRILLTRVVEEVRADREADAVVSFADLMRLAVAVSEAPHARAGLRERFAVVLVDEYQDTSVAQRVMLQNLFSGGFPLTAVGDPLQAIYGWRGASVANIDGFATDFADGRAQAPTLSLSINRRSGSTILDVANAVAEPVRSQHPGVRVLEPAGDSHGRVTAALHDSWADEVRWLVQQVREQLAAGRPADQVAVLCRTNEFVLLVAAELRAAGVPAAAASLGSVLHLPEVVETLSMLRVLEKADNGALVRLLTGPQWRIGAGDLALLGARARQLAGAGESADQQELPDLLQQAVAGVDPVDVLSLMEAVYDPGRKVSAEARTRLRAFTAQLDAIRPALVAGVEEAAHRVVEVTGLGVEVRLGPNATSRLDGLAALFDVITAYRGAHDDPSVSAFLRWLDFAEHLDETPAADFPVRGQAVRVMTVHRAKGLEWDCVFVPALCAGVFPSSQGRDLWTRHYKNLPYPLRGDRARLPVLPGWRAAGGGFAGAFKRAEQELKAQYRQQDALEENRLAYVALTRARDVLFVSGHHWSPKGVLRAPSDYLLAVRQVDGVTLGPWVEEPCETAPAVATGDVQWPRTDEVFVSVEPPVDSNSALTAAESARLQEIDQDIEAVTSREREQSLPVTSAELPQVLSASMLQRAAQDPAALARDLARPMPRVTPLAAARGTAFHEWVAQSAQQLSLIPDWEEAVDADRVVDEDLPALIAGYRTTAYARMVPVATEIEVTATVGGLVVRGIIDAVYRHPDGTWEVVDWKTSREHTADPLQLALYRLGWAQRVAVASREVRTAFVYVRDGQVVRPPLPDDDQLESLVVAAQSQNEAVTAQ
ncbi:MAG TPA: ATP-dependent DNA helicase [Actinomycetota bacterium]|nr:ATP-dependent DNA helicase [Actinomycetota bacterium]